MNDLGAVDGELSADAERSARHVAGQRLIERVFGGTTLAMALLVLALLGGVMVALVHGAWPAFSRFKLAFILRQVWNPVTDEFGALAAIFGTIITSLISML